MAVLTGARHQTLRRARRVRSVPQTRYQRRRLSPTVSPSLFEARGAPTVLHLVGLGPDGERWYTGVAPDAARGGESPLMTNFIQADVGSEALLGRLEEHWRTYQNRPVEVQVAGHTFVVLPSVYNA